MNIAERGAVANLKFYMTPGSCSTGIHVLLEECELFFEAHVVNLMAGDNMRPEYLKINPRGSVPTVVTTDGTALIDFLSICKWVAEAHPKKKLLPESPEDQARALQIIEYATTVVHGEGFTRVFVSDRYAVDPEEKRTAEDEGTKIVKKGFERLDTMVTGSPYAFGAFSIADAALFYVEFWADRVNIEIPAKFKAHFAAMMKRPSVRLVLGEEGYQSVLRKYPA